MDTRDHALTKLTRLHDECHPTPHRPASLRRNYSLPVGSIMELAMRCVGDDEDRRSPSPEPQTDSRFGLPMKNRRRRQLRLVKRDNSFSLIFLEKCDFITQVLGSVGPPGGDNPPRRALRGACPGGLCPPRCPLRWFLAPVFLFYYIKNPRKVSFQSGNFHFYKKTTPW